jgi:hypothetical protein
LHPLYASMPQPLNWQPYSTVANGRNYYFKEILLHLQVDKDHSKAIIKDYTSKLLLRSYWLLIFATSFTEVNHYKFTIYGLWTVYFSSRINNRFLYKIIGLYVTSAFGGESRRMLRIINVSASNAVAIFTFTLKVITAIFAEDNFQHSTRLFPESRGNTLSSSRENLRTKILYSYF